MRSNRDDRSLWYDFLTPWRWRWQRWFAVAGWSLISYLISAPLVFLLLHDTPHPAWVERAVDVFYAPLFAFVQRW